MQERQEALAKLLDSWLEKSLDSDAFESLKKTFQTVEEDAEEWEIFLHFSSIHRRAPNEPFQLTDEDQKEADHWVEGWQPNRWGLDELARARLLLSLSNRGETFFFDILDKLFESSDMREGEALYRSLPILPWPEKLATRAAEGVRSNITSIYQAVAHHNPFPAKWMDDNAWNQMVLKALFIDVPLYRIWGLDQRHNKELFRMVIDLAHERWAAGRTVSPEIWRLVSPWISGNQMNELNRLMESDDSLNRQALRNICMESSIEEVQQILKEIPNDVELQKDPISWDELGRRVELHGDSSYNSEMNDNI